MASKVRKSNIEIIQNLLSQNYSVEQIAMLMVEDKSRISNHYFYWQKRIIELIESGEVTA